MDTLAALAQGFAVAITPAHLMWAAIGVTLGTAIGVLPGIGPSTTVALLLPVTFGLEPASAFIMFGGIYYGAQYGGSTASILLNTPGEAGAVITAIEGNAMARSGRAGPALATAAVGSFIAGTVGTLGLTFVAPWLAEIALKLGPAEYATLMVLALTTVSALFGASVSRGLLSLFLGLLLGTVGLDPQLGQPRFAFGVMELLDGIDTVIVAVGLFAVGETLHVGGALALRERKYPGDERFAMDERHRLGAVVEGMASRHGDRLSDRRLARRRQRGSHRPLLCGGEKAVEAPGGIRQGSDRGRGRARGGE